MSGMAEKKSQNRSNLISKLARPSLSCASSRFCTRQQPVHAWTRLVSRTLGQRVGPVGCNATHHPAQGCAGDWQIAIATRCPASSSHPSPSQLAQRNCERPARCGPAVYWWRRPGSGEKATLRARATSATDPSKICTVSSRKLQHL